MLNKPVTRRGFLGGTCAAAALGLVPGVAAALSAGEARALIDKLVGEINRVIASGKSEAAMIRDFGKLFDRYADVPVMARYALGVDARRASAGQMRDFTQAFSGYIARKYGKRFREFIGGKIEVAGSRKIKAGYEIKSTAYLRGESPFEVTFLVSGKSGQDLFFNMFIEGVNLLLTERTEVGALLDRNGGSINKMIAELRRRG